MKVKLIHYLCIMLIFSIMPCFIGCDKQVSRSDTIGIYKIVYITENGTTLGSEQLLINANGTFKQIYSSSTGKVSNNSGTLVFRTIWRYNF